MKKENHPLLAIGAISLISAVGLIVLAAFMVTPILGMMATAIVLFWFSHAAMQVIKDNEKPQKEEEENKRK